MAVASNNGPSDWPAFFLRRCRKLNPGLVINNFRMAVVDVTSLVSHVDHNLLSANLETTGASVRVVSNKKTKTKTKKNVVKKLKTKIWKDRNFTHKKPNKSLSNTRKRQSGSRIKLTQSLQKKAKRSVSSPVPSESGVD